MKKLSLPWIIIPAAIALLFPLVTSDQYLLHIGVLVLMYIGITVAWNILAFGGILSLGHAAFFGLGAYTVAILYVDFGVNPWIGIVAGGLVAGLGSLFLAIPMVRLRGPFFTLATLAFVEVLRLLAIWAVPVTNGSVGITTPADEGFLYIAFQDREPYYYIVMAMAVLAVWASIWIYRSKLGYHLRAIASDEEAVQALGVKTNRIKVLALVISASMTGVFGAFAAIYFFVIDPATQFNASLYSIQPALNGIIGGMGTIAGPIVGAIVMTPLGEWLRVTFSGAAQGVNFMIYGIVLIVMVRMLPGGLVDGYHAVIRRLKGKKRPEPAAEAAASTDKKENER
ncbi:branched-chain amino acid ABC transporter permease [Citricoccus sp. NR2]|uniref:branched-chain amino acid ABC transporter permease n=1 Tax=Citricoccus sp. NR2 TaxID=3004095 RepID=UPI0022DE772A|nr:branched-chain amino acid ABC transporter permease [Citricoccus sp. NR2]WBL19384.1 branched-chain amino acid ABC transporter permease [Citricoccus sp. NR2]